MPPLSSHLCVLLTPDVIAKLRQQGIRTVADFISTDVALLSQRTAIPAKDLSSIHHTLLSHFAPLPISAADLWEDFASTAALLPTGCNKYASSPNATFLLEYSSTQLTISPSPHLLFSSSLDELLEGGVMTGELMEVTGPPGSGKTQLCLSLAAAVAMGTSSSVVVVDSRGSFSSLRLRDVMVGRRGREEEDVIRYLKRVHVYNAFNLFELLTLIHLLKERVATQEDYFHSNLHLLIIDSITPLLSPLLGGRQAQGHALMSQLALALRTLAQDHFIAIVYTNNTVSDISAGSEGLKPALGRTWSHVPSTRVTLTCNPPRPAASQERERRACLTKSSRQPTGMATAFSISGAGLQPWPTTTAAIY